MTAKRKATIIDVANLSGVSRSMVSYVLNNFEDCKAKPETKRRIMTAVKTLDYHFNANAKALRSGKSRQIGVAMPAPIISFYANMISLLHNELRNHGYTAIFGLWSDSGKDQQDTLRNLVETNNLAGIIAWDMDIPEIPGLHGIPVVLFSNYDEPQRFDMVDTDIDITVKQAVEHLVSSGFTRIGYCGVLLDRRVELTKQLLREKGLPLVEQWFMDCTVDEKNIYGNINKLCSLPEPPEALIFNNDLVAVTACKLLKNMNVPLPAMISLQDSNLLRFNVPTITAFDTREKELATGLVDLLLKRLQLHNKFALTKRYIQPQLIVRESTSYNKKA